MNKALFAAVVIGFFASSPMVASAGGRAAPPPAAGAKKDAPATLPANPKFVEYQNGFTWTMRIDGLGKRGDSDGYIQYEKYDFENANVISGVSVQGIEGVPGVGAALKKHLLELYKESTFESDLIKTNRDRLLGLWSKSYPGAPSASELRNEVPALSTRFGNDFDFELKAFPSTDGGFIHLWVKPKGTGRVTVANPDAITQMVLADPKLRPAAAKKEDDKKKEEAKREEEAKKREDAKREEAKREEEAKKREDAKKKEDDKKGKGKGR